MNPNDNRFVALVYTYVLGVAVGLIINEIQNPSETLLFVLAITAGVVGVVWSYVIYNKVIAKEVKA